MNRRLVVVDKDNHRVVFLTMDGEYISYFGTRGHGNGEFSYPWDVDISPDGNLIVVTDSRNHRIQLFDKFGNYLRKYCVFEDHPFDFKDVFDYPRGVSFDNQGTNESFLSRLTFRMIFKLLEWLM
jgi:DNA-binding beta-propeller fold protein YncE